MSRPNDTRGARQGEGHSPVSSNEVERRPLDGQIASHLGAIRTLLERAHPPLGRLWYQRLYRAAQKTLKWIGLPALVLAAILPVQELLTGLRENRNRRFVTNTYHAYALDLLERGQSDRALRVLTELADLKTLDVQSQYTKAKILAFTALKQGRNYVEAEDTLNILLMLHRNRGAFFPSIGGDDDVFALELATIDIMIARQRYGDAREALGELPAAVAGDRGLRDAEIGLRLGQILVLEHRFEDAITALAETLSAFGEAVRVDGLADAHFQLGKAHQFQNSDDLALQHYEAARRIYEKREDKHSLLRTYNNVAMIHMYNRNHDESERFFRLEEKLARDVDDDEGLARALFNLAIVRDRRGDTKGAISDYLEALEVYRASGDTLGRAAAESTLASAYSTVGDHSRALHYGRNSLQTFCQLEELRGIGAVAGTLGDVHRVLGSGGEYVFYYLLSVVMTRHVGDERNTRIRLGHLQGHKARVGSEQFEKEVAEAVVRIDALVSELEREEIDTAVPAELRDG